MEIGMGTPPVDPEAEGAEFIALPAEPFDTPAMLEVQKKYHAEMRRHGWVCQAPLGHPFACPLKPVWYRHPVERWRMR